MVHLPKMLVLNCLHVCKGRSTRNSRGRQNTSPRSRRGPAWLPCRRAHGETVRGAIRRGRRSVPRVSEISESAVRRLHPASLRAAPVKTWRSLPLVPLPPHLPFIHPRAFALFTAFSLNIFLPFVKITGTPCKVFPHFIAIKAYFILV